MKKTLTINLGGIVFNIDDDAFVVLKNYLDTIKGYFDNSEGRDEIMTDIESRIAEMLTEKMNGGKEVINSNDISAIIKIMGQPEDYISDDMDEQPRTQYTQSSQHTYTHANQTTSRRLFRDTESGNVGGVCAGIGHYFGVDPIWFRMAFVLSVLFLGTGIFLYIILWIIMPEARTSAEKLSMRGEPVTFENIGKTVEEEMKNVKKKFSNFDNEAVNNTAHNVKSGLNQVGSFLVSIFKFAFQAIGKILGFLFLIFGGLILFALIVGIFTPVDQIFFESGSDQWGYSLIELSNLFFPSGMDFWLTITGFIMLIAVPLIALIFAGTTMLFGAKPPKYTGIALAGVWILGIILTAIGGLRTSVEFSKDSSISEVTTLNELPSDTIYLDILNEKQINSSYKYSHGNREPFRIKDGQLTIEDVEVNVLETNSKYPQLEIIKQSRGKNYSEADQRAENIQFSTQIDSNTIYISPFFTVSSDDKWRNQSVQVNLYLPTGKTVFLPKSYKHIIYDIKNYHDTYDKNMVNMFWSMTDSGLVSPKIMKREKKRMDQDANDFEKFEINITTDDEEHSIIIQ